MPPYNMPSSNFGGYDPYASDFGMGQDFSNSAALQNLSFDYKAPYVPGVPTPDKNGSGFGWNMPTVNAGIQGFGQLSNVYLGLKQLGLAKESFKFQKQAYNKNLANQTSSYNTQMRDRVTGRNYNTEEERRAAESAAMLPY